MMVQKHAGLMVVNLFYAAEMMFSLFWFGNGERTHAVQTVIAAEEWRHPDDFNRSYQSSSRLALWKHKTVQTNMKNDVNSINMAPVPIKPACLRMMGMAMLPTADAPVKNLAAFIHLQYETKAVSNPKPIGKHFCNYNIGNTVFFTES
ncbi:hypothetical protein QQ045_028530 [Rhodiola kirilowii]